MVEEVNLWRPRILVAGGGTGGHVYPAIAVADAIRGLVPVAAIAFAGTQDRLEWTAVPKAGYPIHPITISGFQRSLSLRNLSFPFKLLKGLKQSWELVKSFDPDVVVGTGGYVSGPVLWVAHRQGRPIVIQEQNAYAGVTNKLLAKHATRIHMAFEDAKQYFPTDKCVLSGNPTRKVLTEAERSEGRRYFDIPTSARVLFLFGGSLGSLALNKAMQVHAHPLLADENLYIIWQTGRRYFERLNTPQMQHDRLRLLQYVDRMDLAYVASDLVVSRAGAITCSELMVTGVPAILVPSPNVAEDHQTKNAQAMVRQSAAHLLPEPELDRLADEVKTLMQDEGRRNQMSEAARHMAKPNAASEIAKDIIKIAKSYR